jgi:hypothetical protein
MRQPGLPVGILILLFMSITPLTPAYSQNDTLGSTKIGEEGKESCVSVNFGADLVSRYVWRGVDYGNSPAIQPNIYLKACGFKAGFWGSYAFTEYSRRINDSTVENMGNFAEFDFYVAYTYKYFTIMAYDFFLPNGLDPNYGNKYYNFDPKTTGHTLELSLAFAGPAKFPLQLTVGTLVYGADKGKDSAGVYGYGPDNNYSTYIEAAYPFSVKTVDLKVFVAGTPFGSSWYGPYAGITNVGLTASRPIPLSKSYSLPVFASIITNPQAQSVFFVFGISL